jgi:signal transduction histidine kinase
VLADWREQKSLLPVLILTAHDRFADLVAGFRAGADDFLAKPFRNEEVVLRLMAFNLVAHAREAAAKLAHGLKTPLAVLAARFGMGGTSPDLKVTDAVDSMRRLIDQNLKTARAARASVAFSDTVPVRPVVEDLVFAFSHVFCEHQLLVDVDILEDLAFRGSRDDLQEMLGNLLENAHAWAASRVSVSAGRKERDDLTIAIRDDGPGFPGSILVAMAQDSSSSPADYATSPTGERPAQSNGFGLRITRDIAARYNGRLELANSAGNGAVATLRLP